ncbi:DUF1028 domain-containing protein [Leeia oryzae]|uniref:DUF1028 domain-containing protein n=1 Tax=Leeia oryzae TaxID=356662 RepID=UPI00036B0764|nr:DUF1028 domain-containing protein [Leeia oryzae]
MTFSIAARCPETGMVGVALASSSICVASRCANVMAGVGAALSQNVTNPVLGQQVLTLMARGESTDRIIDILKAEEPFIEWRQLVMVPLKGQPAIFSGNKALGVYGAAIGIHSAAAGNLLATSELPQIMVDAFESASGSLPERLLAAMQAAVAAGGEAGPIHAAGLKVADQQSWPVVDLRVDWADEDPIGALSRLWQMYQPQMQDYITRAINPASAPSYGVPGDL